MIKPTSCPRHFIAALALAACFLPAPVAAQSLDGQWASAGYGLIFDLHGQVLRRFEVTAISCLADPDSLVRTSDPTPDVEAAFGAPGRPARLLVLAGADGDHKRLHPIGTASDILIHRVRSRPDRCDQPAPNTPLDNFDIFARTWDEQYILFDQKKVDWSGAVRRARAKITSATPPAELFDILKGLIEPFHDAHTSVSAPDLKLRFSGLRAGTDASIPGGLERLVRAGPETFLMTIQPELYGPGEKLYLESPLKDWCNGRVRFGMLKGAIGYLRILSFSSYLKDGSYQAERVALDAALDTVFTNADRMKGLVIDVRINFGGSDPLGLAIAERLATTEYLAYSKEARADPVDRTKWTPGQPSRVRPSSRPGFRGPVVELTGPLTISAGETFTQALMGRRPRVIRVGEATQGVFSDVLGRRLPNGWRFGLPNEVFRTGDGRTFDGEGIPPDVRVPVFTAADRQAGKDRALTRAVELIQGTAQ